MRRLFYVPALVVLALASVLVAADVKVDQNPVAADGFGVVSIELGKDESALWEFDPEPVKVKEYKTATGTDVVFNGPKGTSYKFRADVFKLVGGKVEVVRKRETIAIAGNPEPKPDPRPGPDPKPDPNPGPVGTVAKFVVVEDTSKAGPWRGAILGDPKVASFYKASQLTHRLIDLNADGDDAEAQKYKGLAAGKQLPYLWLLDASGKVIKEMPAPTTSADAFVDAFRTHTGEYAMGAIMAAPKLKWTVFGTTPDTPLIQREQWKPVNLETFLPPVHNQKNVGQCASSSACTLLEFCRAQAGLPPVYLSAGDLYDRVNGGRDNGSMPEDNLNELLTNGVAPASKVPYVWDGRHRSDSATVASRKPFKLAQAYRCDSFDALASALQQGFGVQIAIWWYDNFRPDSSGVLPRQGRGGRGGHALMAYGLTKLSDGTWALLVRNSWDVTWGVNGNCVIPESLFAQANQFGAVWAARAAVQSGTTLSRKVDMIDVFADRSALAP